jgi:hypothetical protein
MAKNLKSDEVISMISKKIALKKELRTAKKESDEKTITKLSEKIDKIEDKLHSTPLSKT